MSKKIFSYLPILCVASLVCCLSACDNFLDIRPLGRVIPKTATEYRELLTHAYSIFPEDRGMTSFRSDEMTFSKAYTSASDYDSYFDIWAWNDASPSRTTSSFSWRSFYQVIFEACVLIENRDNISGADSQTLNQLLGEAYMLRAYAHFVLANLYGKPYTQPNAPASRTIPLKRNSSTEEVLQRNSLSEVYAFVLEDIAKAETLLNVELWEAPYRYRFGRLAVDAFRSRVFLYMGDWQKSLEASKRVLHANGKLQDLTSGKMLPNNYKSDEAIVALERCLTSGFQTAGTVSDELLNSYSGGDKRKSLYFQAITLSAYRAAKGGGGELRCSFRKAEIYLNAAEAAAQLGTLDEAKSLLLELMKHRYTSAALSTQQSLLEAIAGQQELLDFIQAERRRELAFEGHRWFDLRRTTRPKLEKSYEGKNYVLESDSETYTLKIPTEAIEANPGLAN